MQEKRKFVRFPRRLEAAYELSSPVGGDERVVQTETANISEGGCTLLTSRTELPGARLVVHLALPSGEEIALGGRIAWLRQALGMTPGMIGVYFDEHQPLPSAYKELLQ
jgi:hypothetical protein